MFILLGILITSVVGVISYFYWQMSYWKRRNIVEVQGKSLFTGHYHLFFADEEKTFTRKLGDFTKVDFFLHKNHNS